MAKNNKGSALVILLVLPLLIGILATVYFFKNNGNDCGGFMGTACPFGFSCKIIGGDAGKCKNILFPMSTPSDELTPEVAKKILPLPDPTANWKTYTNNKYGYSLKYPNDYSFNEVSVDYVRFSSGSNDPKLPARQTYLSIQFDANPDPSKNPAAIYKIAPDGKTLRISQIMMDVDLSQKPQVQSVFDQILSTFKFL